MTPERWSEIERVCHAALSHHPHERAAFVVHACAGDAALRHEVESLLAQEPSAAGFMSMPAGDSAMLGEVSFVGRQMASYTIHAQIGAGGMGDVYRGRDAKLGRDVAIKILPRLFTTDPDRLARFEREARVLASLNHPHIGAIYGVEDIDGIPALVLELVEGETLAELIAGSTALPITQSLEIARQIADALEAAHEKGIVHRDLKPANIQITPDGSVKVLDFGLAKLAGSSAEAGRAVAEPTDSPTITSSDTRDGVVLGTAAYMSPEQARWKPVDRRTDMWAFGCVLFEMLTGRAAFAGDTISDTIVAVLEREPDRTLLPPDLPAQIHRLLRRCFEKDRRRRLDSAAAARLEIDEALMAPHGEGHTAAAPSGRVAPVAAAASVVGAVLAALVMWIVVRPAPQAPGLPSRFAIVSPPGQPVNVSGADRDVAVSPDGRHLVYRFGGTTTAGGPLMVRAIDQLGARRLADIKNAFTPFFSPDSRWIGFIEDAELKKVSLAGGPVVALCPVLGASLGASWGDDNTIVFATDDPGTGLWRVSADGGEPAVLTKPDAALHESDHLFPLVLPHSRGVLFTITAAGQADKAQVAVLDPKTGQRKTLVRGGNQADYIDRSAGSGQTRSNGSRQDEYVIYAAGGALRAVRFDPVRLDVLGDPVTVVENVMMKPSGAANYAVSRSGTLVYMPAGAVSPTPVTSLVWVDRSGHEEPINAPMRAYGPPRLSPDGNRVALGIVDQQANTEIWILDLRQERLRRLTFSPGMDGLPVWTPDGRRIIFMSARTGVLNLYSQAADGTGTVDRLTTSASPQWPTAITPDGTYLAGFNRLPKETYSDVVFFPLTRPVRRPRSEPAPGVSLSPTEQLAETRFKGGFVDFSPNGRYLAYQSEESGRLEVYVRPFPRVDNGRWQVSTAGGARPAWARDGRELFYLDASNTLIAVRVSTSGSTFSVGSAKKVFDAKYAEPNPSRHYDVSADGRRFIMIKEGATGDPNATPASMVVVLNWTEELNQRVPKR